MAAPGQSSGEHLVGQVRFPPEWIGLARFTHIDLVATADLESGVALLVLFVLSDGSNLAAVTYPDGQALLRIAPMGTTVESHFDGARPSKHPKTEAAWGIAIESMHAALAKKREELGL